MKSLSIKTRKFADDGWGIWIERALANADLDILSSSVGLRFLCRAEILNKHYFLFLRYKQVLQHNDFVIYRKESISIVYYHLN